MKLCPYCKKEIQDAAIKCRWCLKDLSDDIQAVGGVKSANDESKFINWNEECESDKKQVEMFCRHAALCEIPIDEVSVFLTTCRHLCEAGRGGELKSRLDDQLHIYKKQWFMKDSEKHPLSKGILKGFMIAGSVVGVVLLLVLFVKTPENTPEKITSSNPIPSSSSSSSHKCSWCGKTVSGMPYIPNFLRSGGEAVCRISNLYDPILSSAYCSMKCCSEARQSYLH